MVESNYQYIPNAEDMNEVQPFTVTLTIEFEW